MIKIPNVPVRFLSDIDKARLAYMLRSGREVIRYGKTK